MAAVETYYAVRVTIGEATWNLHRSIPSGKVTDGVTVLAGLTFGWAMPANALWPLQPSPMDASFALNVPEFPDMADADEGQTVAIEVAFADASVITARVAADAPMDYLPEIIDGVQLDIGDRVLLTAQSDPAVNGIVVYLGDTSLTRSSDMDSWDTEVVGAQVHVTEGDTYQDTYWSTTATPGGTIDVTDMPWDAGDRPVGPIVFAFYGRVTDLVAVPRAAPRTGVTLSCVAVDYTVDPNELTTYGTADATPVDEVTLLSNMWAALGVGYIGMGLFPTWPLAPTADVAQPGPSGTAARTLIDNVLLQAAPSNSRVIFAPSINELGVIQTDEDFPKFVFDALAKIPDTDAPLVIAGEKVQRNIQWARRKRRAQPSRLEVTGIEGTTPGVADVTGEDLRPILAQLATISADDARLDLLADFYLPATPARGWAIEGIRYFLSREDPETLDDLPLDLMPRWREAEGGPTRASCYRKAITILGIANDLNPYWDPEDTATADLMGVLTGVRLTIQDGQMYLDLLVRQTEPVVTEEG